MPFSDLLLPELDAEIESTRKTLSRVPKDKGKFAPHPRSTPLERLAPHVAQLAGFGEIVLTTPELDFSTAGMKALQFESPEQLLRALDEGAKKTRSALKATPDSAWTQPWKLSIGANPIFTGSRYVAYRQMFLNHMVHHRAQLGVYLRMNDLPVPSIYGPSADDKG
jgi:uncharacterized damage-inducible protein DinB